MGSIVAEIAERIASSSAGARTELEIRGGLALPGTLLLSTAETTVVDGNKLGQIDFQAPVDTAGTDAILVAASIYAEADATFSSSVNATELVFATGASEAAAEKMRLTSDGKVGINQSSPGAMLHITENTDADNTQTVLKLSRARAGGNFTDDAGGAIEFSLHDSAQVNATVAKITWAEQPGGGDNDDYLAFHTLDAGSMTEQMRLTDSKVGIGTTQPRNYIEIKAASPTFSLNTSGTGDSNMYWELANATEWRFYTDGGNHRFYFLDNNSTMYQINRDDTSFNFSSDERLKEDISTISGGLDKINGLRGVNFKWNEVSNKQTGENKLGFIAQEVKDHIPEAVSETQLPEHKGTELEDTYVMSRDTLLPVMVEAIKELSSKVTALENA